MHNQSLDQLLDMPVMSKEQASQMSNLQGGAQDPSDEDKCQKIYLISLSNCLKKDKARRDCNPSERKSKTSTWPRSFENIKQVELETQVKTKAKRRC